MRQTRFEACKRHLGQHGLQRIAANGPLAPRHHEGRGRRAKHRQHHFARRTSPLRVATIATTEETRASGAEPIRRRRSIPASVAANAMSPPCDAPANTSGALAKVRG